MEIISEKSYNCINLYNPHLQYIRCSRVVLPWILFCFFFTPLQFRLHEGNTPNWREAILNPQILPALTWNIKWSWVVMVECSCHCLKTSMSKGFVQGQPWYMCVKSPAFSVLGLINYYTFKNKELSRNPHY